MRLIGIGGSTASGKTVLAERMIEHFGAATHRFSLLLEARARALGYATDKSGLQQLSTMLRSTEGEDVLAREMSAWVASHTSETIVIEGMRRDIDVRTLEETARATGRAWTFFFVDAPIDTRFVRFNGRLAKHELPPVTHEAFCALEAQESEVELPHLKNRAHFLVHNEGKSIEEMFREALAHVK